MQRPGRPSATRVIRRLAVPGCHLLHHEVAQKRGNSPLLAE